MKVSALFLEGIEHVQREVFGARGEQAVAIALRLWRGAKLAYRPPEYRRGIHKACRVVIREGRRQSLSDGYQKVH